VLNLIHSSRADDYCDWMNVGKALFAITNGDPQAYELWVQFSKRSTKYEKDECEKAWDCMTRDCQKEWSCMVRDGPRSIGCLLHMAKNDSPDEYASWMRTLQAV